MKILIVSKIPFSTPDRPQMSMAGHTVNFIPSLKEELEKCGHACWFLIPDRLAPDEAPLSDPTPGSTDNRFVFRFGGERVPKTIFHTSDLAFESELEWLLSENLFDYILIIGCFPSAIHVSRAVESPGIGSNRPKVIGFLRGKDGYYWTRPEVYPALSPNTDSMLRLHEKYISSLRSFDRLYCVSETQASVLRDCGLSVHGILPSPPTPRVKQSRRVAKAAMAKLPTLAGELNPDQLWLGVVGRIHRDKAPLLAMDVFDRVLRDDVQLVFFGDGDLSLIRSIKQESSNNARIAALPVSPKSLGVMYASIDAVLHPSNGSGGFLDPRPSSLISAAANGIPVVGLDVGGVRECISPLNANSLLVSPELDHCRQVDELASLIDELFSNNELIESVGSCNKEHIKNVGIDTLLEQFVLSLEGNES